MIEKQEQSLVNIIIPVHNGEDYIADALRSILNQDSTSFKIIVVDDASTDASVEIASEFKSVEIIRSSKVGQGEALNIGIRASEGSLIAFLDADDLWMPGKLNTQVQYLFNNSDCDGVYGLTEQFQNVEQGKPSGISSSSGPPQDVLFLGSLLIRRESLLRTGLFSSDTQINCLFDWNFRARRSGLKIDLVNEVVLKRRIHKDNLTVRERSSVVKGYLKAIKRHLETSRLVDQRKD